MELTIKKVTKWSPDYKKVKEILDTAFPKRELFPTWLLRFAGLLNRKIEFLSFYDKDVLVGVTYTVHTSKMVIPLYLAVDEQQRSKGYGAALLSNLKERYKGLPLTIETEIADPSADNYHQRIRRIRFYEQNGFQETGWYLTDRSGKYALMSTAEHFFSDDYKNTLLSFMHGLYEIRVDNF